MRSAPSQYGDADVMITGGSEATVTPMAIGGFANMQALSERNDSPETASRPFDATRDGFVMGEGAGVVILEELEHAKQRGAKIYAEIVGYGATGDAYHITQPAPDGEGAQRAMRRASRTPASRPRDVGYINAHGTSTPANDFNETRAIKAVFGDHAQEAQRQLDQVGDRPHARRRGRAGVRRQLARRPRRRHSADDQLQNAGSGVRPRTTRRTRRRSATSRSPSATASASAGTTSRSPCESSGSDPGVIVRTPLELPLSRLSDPALRPIAEKLACRRAAR